MSSCVMQAKVNREVGFSPQSKQQYRINNVSRDALNCILSSLVPGLHTGQKELMAGASGGPKATIWYI